jgi:hypothetical protein
MSPTVIVAAISDRVRKASIDSSRCESAQPFRSPVAAASQT